MKLKAEIVEHTRKGHYFLLSLYAPEIARVAEAGQFVNIRCANTLDPLLRRPFSFYSIDRDTGMIKILYEVKGRGTEILSGYQEGDFLDIMGPLGRGISVPEKGSQVILVGGGVGSAPMAALAEKLYNHDIKEICVLLGASTRDRLIPFEVFQSLGLEISAATEDGSMGYKGFVTDLLLENIERFSREKCLVYACGPKGMLRATAKICNQRKVRCIVLMDAFMACGVGACQSCVHKVRKEKGEETYVRVCTEGPHFDAREVVWE
ncbi:MAG: dihydroorotate dehydrogenase electron transfer subunit [Clostridia bacterium]|nr:dihydroorotate dehydrogenase electron transfer subunit [Clostridia bacterium]